jgi:hypothetical protein
MKKLTNKVKSTTTPNKLTLRRETIAFLTPLQLGGIAGGDISGDFCATLASRTGPCNGL